MHNEHLPGPELALVGAARSGTSFLAAHLAHHPGIDAPSVKEPNFCSRHFGKGLDWYEGFYPPRAAGHIRMDASTTYTFPQFPEALPRLAEIAPHALIVYVVRNPLERAYSHYRHEHDYFRLEKAGDFGTATRDNPVFLGASDYGRWLACLRGLFGDDQILVVPFTMVVADCAQVTAVICERLGLGPWRREPPAAAGVYRNNVVTFRSDLARILSDRVRRSRLYPALRTMVGPARVRRLRSMLTREIQAPSLDEALTNCSASQLDRLREFAESASRAVDTTLADQDKRLSLSWLPHWIGG